MKEPIVDRVRELPPSATMAVGEKARQMAAQGIDVIPLAGGDPDFPTPQHIQEAALAAMRQGKTGYTSTRGIPELRQAISEKLARENGITADPAREMLVTLGGKEALFATIVAMIGEGDEVLMPEPLWVSYDPCVRIAGGKLVHISPSSANEFHVSGEEIERAITPNTKMIIINNPTNPTGLVWTREELEAVAAIAQKHDLWVISDEVYEKILYDGAEMHSIAALPGMAERTITINALSKTYAMTGWRVGYLVANADLVGAIHKVHQHSVTCACSFAQYGAVAALNGPQDCVEEMRAEYERRRDLIVDGLNSIAGLSCSKPRGAFYAFPDISQLGMSSGELANFLIEKAHVAVTPGIAFGPSGDRYLRLSFATATSDLEKALERIEKAAAELL